MSGQIITVCGPGRSGTTMLDLMLGNAGDVFSCGEVYAWFRPWRRHHFSISCACGQAPCPVWDGLKDVPESEFHVEALRQTGVNFVVDSSKELCWVVDTQRWAAAKDLAVSNVLLWKSPVELAYSGFKRGMGLMFWREQFVRYYEEFFDGRIPFVSVFFDELARNPVEKLQRLCDSIGMPYFPGKEDFWGKEHHHLFGSRGTRNQVESGRSAVRPTSFSEEFTARVPELHDTLDRDEQVRAIEARLREHEVSSTATGPSATPMAGRRPWWYYPRRAKQMLRRYVPKAPPNEG